jgi:PTS system nitrogen regulatory IIA component
MDLKLKDVTELLNVSEATIKRWISDGKIPYYRLHNQYRFSRSEIENWVLSCKQGGDFSPFDDEGSPKEKLGTQQFGLFRAVHKGGVYSQIEGDTKEEVIRNAMQKIAQDLHLDAEVITELLIDRENLMPTALSNGIGVPHTRDFLLQESYDVIAVVFPAKPIEYGALDGKPVHTLFFLFACDDKRHLHLLAKLAHLSSKAENLSFLKKNPSKLQLLEYIKNWEANIKPSPRSESLESVAIK